VSYGLPQPCLLSDTDRVGMSHNYGIVESCCEVSRPGSCHGVGCVVIGILVF
jgi:hypothetical protein